MFSGERDTDEDRQDLETLAASLKPFSTWSALDTIQTAREACGGAGFLAENRFTQLHADLDIYTTFEGDNNVLLQLVAKRLLTDYARRLAKPDAAAIARYAGQQAGAAVSRSGLRALGQKIGDFGSTARSIGNVRGEAAQRQLLTDRVETMVAAVAGRLKNAGSLAPEAAAKLFNDNQNELIEAAYAHGELLEWEAFSERLATIEHAGNKQVLTWLRDLFGFHADREAPRLVPHQRAPVGIPGRGDHRLHRRPAAAAASPTRGRPDGRLPVRARAPARAPSRRAPSASGRTRRAPTTSSSGTNGTAPVEEKALAKQKAQRAGS